MKGNFRKASVFLLLAGFLAGCGSTESTEDIAVISEYSQEGALMNAIVEAAEQYADDNSLVAEIHEVANDTTEDYQVSIQEAAEAGADVIIGYGEAFEEPLYTMQKKYKNVSFIIVDGAPRQESGGTATIRSNTLAIDYNEAEAGFLAGYAAVKEGYRNLGYLGGEKDSRVAMYGSGFVQGAAYAASELGLASDEVTVSYGYLGTNQISPSVMASAEDWYDSGCQVIFANGGDIISAVTKAAEETGKKVIGSDVASEDASSSLLTTVVKDVSDTIYTSIGSVYENDFGGGKKQEMNVSNGGVSMVMDNSLFAVFSADDYLTLTTAISDGTIEVEESYVTTINEAGGLGSLTLNIISF